MIDIIIILLFLMFATVGLKRGILKEAVYFIGTILIFYIAFKFKDTLGATLCKYLPFYSFDGPIKGMISLNILLYQAVAFLILVGILYSIFGVILSATHVMQKIVNATIILAIPSKIAGFILGLVECYIIMFVVLVLFAVPLRQLPGFEESTLVKKIISDSPAMLSDVKNVQNAVNDIYSSIDSVKKRNKTTNEINLKNIDIMLKYKLVSKKTVRDLVALDKLREIQNIDTVLSKYEN